MRRSGRATPDELEASLTLQELVLSRVDSLPPAQGDIVRRAAVIGVAFTLDEVQALLSAEERGVAVRESLAGLEAARLILRTGEESWAFRQTLVREAIYHSQSFARRRELHTRLADYLAARHAADLTGNAELLAHHYERGGCTLSAARYLILSGAKARERATYPQAATYFERAIRALAQLPEAEAAEAAPLRAAALEGQGDVALLQGDFAAAVRAYKEALRSSDGSPAEARLRLKLALALPPQGRAAEGLDQARQAMALRGAGDGPAAAVLAWLLWRGGDPEAGAWIARARRQVEGEMVQALLTDLAGEWAAAARAYQAAGQPVGAALTTCRLGDAMLAQGRVEEALARYAQAAEIWKGESDAVGLALASYRQAQAHRQSGDDAAAWLALFDAGSLLSGAEPATGEDREAIRQALAALEAGGDWPDWWPRRYDDAFRVLVLFQAFARAWKPAWERVAQAGEP